MSDLFYRVMMELDKDSFNVYKKLKSYAQNLYVELDLSQVKS